MGKRKICPKCGNILFIDREPDGWYEWCINCSYRDALKDLADSNLKLVKRDDHQRR